ncbi:hypothetical protein BU24DRAFT_407163 [Aaosphaeria arxii CBS 175.79]|uniref:Uncharacterized protein n=1 Tax=Aaosphaeria arxii CBS 175.79 TaxID=1450172 RepID=A0A6A5XWR6_9PLEO|nr:uncharacterized protein BU24DRAFT_407163 [Aaosphaeria arxii CBS 175.79]KAF2017090.1 hypothetical protein BU24DRAFT_407163 [Aaosphaeria arxii CBS 175.79]
MSPIVDRNVLLVPVLRPQAPERPVSIVWRASTWRGNNGSGTTMSRHGPSAASPQGIRTLPPPVPFVKNHSSAIENYNYDRSRLPSGRRVKLYPACLHAQGDVRALRDNGLMKQPSTYVHRCAYCTLLRDPTVLRLSNLILVDPYHRACVYITCTLRSHRSSNNILRDRVSTLDCFVASPDPSMLRTRRGTPEIWRAQPVANTRVT